MKSPPSTAEPAQRAPGAGDTNTASGRNVAIRFRRLSVFPRTRQIVADDRRIELGDRAFDILIALLAAPGTLITKYDLIDRVWPSGVVEGNLHVQISALRRALGEDRDVIRTISGRGYMFVGDVAVRASPDREPAVPVAAPAPIQRRERPVVAIVDDDSDVREALAGLLQSVGILVEPFSSVQDFLAGDSASPPDCLLLDVQLPRKSGLDFLDELARTRALVPVIFISGYADVAMSVRAMKGGAFAFFTKPLSHRDLLDAIRRAIESRSGSRSAVAAISV